MPSVSRTFAVAPSADAVVDYLKDFAHAEEWDPGTRTCTRVDEGPIAVGARWHNVSEVAGRQVELEYTLTEFTAERLVFVGRTDTATSTDAITVRPRARGAEVEYRARLDLQGRTRLAAPLMWLLFQKLARDTRRQLTAVLARRAATQA